MKLQFPKDDADFAQSLSAVVRVGDDLWVGGDEWEMEQGFNAVFFTTKGTKFTKVFFPLRARRF